MTEPSTETAPAASPPAAVLPALEPQRRREIAPEFIAAGLFILALLPFLPALHNGYIWDDDHHVTGNPVLRSVNGLYRIWFVPGQTPQYYPLAFTVFWLEFKLFALKASGYHTVNLFLHGANVLLLWRVLLRIGLPGRAAILAAALWGVHPVQVETVDWIMELKNLLSTGLYLLSARLLLRGWGFALPRDKPLGRHAHGRLYLGALVLFLLALLAKSVTASLPAAFLLVLWWKRGGFGWGDLKRMLPFFIIGAAAGLFTSHMEHTSVGASGPEWELTPLQRVLIAGRAASFYAGKLAWPQHLTFFYPRWNVDPAAAGQWLFPLGALGVVAALFVLRHRIGRGPLAAVLFFLGTLSPALGFVSVYPFRYSFVADHFQYMACAGLLTLAAAMIARAPLRAAVPVATLLLLALGARSYARCFAFRDAFTLYQDVVAQDSHSWVGHALLASEYADRDDVDDPRRPAIHEAITEFSAATQLAPKVVENFEGLAQMEMKLERFPEAAARINALLERDDLTPARRAALYSDLGLVATLQNRADDAMAWYRKAIATDPPSSYTAHYNLGRILALRGKIDESIQEFDAALKFAPESSDANLAMGMSLATENRLDEAIFYLQRAAAYNPQSSVAKATLDRAIALRDHQRYFSR
jgi:tetratricopeptide (TPR) repeat protein